MIQNVRENCIASFATPAVQTLAFPSHLHFQPSTPLVGAKGWCSQVNVTPRQGRAYTWHDVRCTDGTMSLSRWLHQNQGLADCAALISVSHKLAQAVSLSYL